MEQILDLRIALRYLVVPIRRLSYIFVDNDRTLNSSVTPQGKIRTRCAALSFYRVMESIAAKIISYNFINGKINPADILSKY